MLRCKRLLLLLQIWLMVRFSAGEPDQQDLPKVTLPWGTWQANSLDPDSKLLTFQNIRFGKAPNGTLRFQLPRYPDKVSSPEKQLMDNTYGPMCYQVSTRPPSCDVPTPSTKVDEDCLFLDVYVPQSTWEKGKAGIKNTPVVVWIFGGAYEFGAKSAFGPTIPFYQGDGLIAAAKNYTTDMIFVSGNYRLGAFGWLAGTTMEGRATANAGLYDQRLVLQWVQDYIGLFGGDKNNVAAWGESAGGGSIVHHLVARGGQQNPLFQRAFIQSPGFQWKWDRTGTLEETFKNFTKFAKCKEGDFDCLVKASPAVLSKANQALFDQSWALGLFPVGPSLDNNLFKELPATALKNGRYWKGITALATSHVRREANNFTPHWVKTEQDFDTFLKNLFPENSFAKVRDLIKKQYPTSKFKDQQERLGQVISDVAFLCNTRHMYDAYSSKISVYSMFYDFLVQYAIHASDLMPTFWTPKFDVKSFLSNYICHPTGAGIYAAIMKQLAPLYQSYLADLAAFGNPNQHPKDTPWNPARSDANGVLQSVFRVQVGPFFQSDSPDELTTSAVCNFWTNIAGDITSTGAVDVDDAQIVMEEL